MRLALKRKLDLQKLINDPGWTVYNDDQKAKVTIYSKKGDNGRTCIKSEGILEYPA